MCTGVAVQRCAPAVDQGRDANNGTGGEAMGGCSSAGTPLTSSDAAGCCCSTPDSPDECRFLGGQADGPSQQIIDASGGRLLVAASPVPSVAPVEPTATASGSLLLYLICLIYFLCSSTVKLALFRSID